MDDLVHVGFVLKTHGYQGNIKISLTLEEAQDIETEWVMLIINRKPVPFFVIEKSNNHKEWLILLEDIDSDTKAKELIGLQVYLAKDLLPDLPDHTSSLITGYQLIDDQEGDLGTIQSEFESAKQTFIAIEYQNHEVMIPFVDDIIYHIDHNKKQAFSKLPEGLLEINL